MNTNMKQNLQILNARQWYNTDLLDSLTVTFYIAKHNM